MEMQWNVMAKDGETHSITDIYHSPLIEGGIKVLEDEEDDDERNLPMNPLMEEWTWGQVCIYTHTYIHTYIHTCIHTYIITFML